MNYTALQTAVQEYLHRTDLNSGSPTKAQDFIERARVRIGRDLRSLEQVTTAALSSWSSDVAALPTDLIEIIQVRNGTTILYPVNFHEIETWAGTATPAVYAVYGRNIKCPGAASLTLTYYKIDAALSSGATEHATMAAFPSLWIFAAVGEGAIYGHDLDLATTMLAQYQEEVRRINAAAQRARTGPAPAMVDTGRYATFAEAVN